jgi:uncharacterized protein
MNMSVRRWARRHRRVLAVGIPAVAFVAASVVLVAPAQGVASTGLVVNEVYGGGGNAGSLWTTDFIELTNRSGDPIDVTGWSVQYHSASATGTWQVTALSGVIDPGELYLVAESTGTGGTQPLPTPDVTGTIAMSATAGTVALVNSTPALTCTADTCIGVASIVDLVGFGTAAIRETNPVLGASNTTSVQRRGTADTDDNSADLFAANPSPKAVNVEPTPTQCPAQPGPTRIHDIQGNGWLSPLRNQNVTNVPAVVTGVRAAGSSRGFWIQDPSPDADPSTSEGLFVFTSSTAITVRAGDAVMVSGRVQNFYPLSSGEVFPNTANLSITEISGPTVLICSRDNPLPAAELITADSLPDTYAASSPTGNIEDVVPIDPTRSVQEFWRSRLGMVVRADDVRVVGPGNEFGEVYVTAKPDEQPSARGGTLFTGYDATPTGRIVVFPVTGSVAPANVGDTLSGSTVGPVDYILFGGFGIAATSVGTLTTGTIDRQVVTPGEAEQLSVATYNVENLSPEDPVSKFDGLAHGIVDNLRSPDIVTLEEIQDNNGATDDGTVDANETLDLFVEAIVRAGGPAYEWRQINPENLKDGGEPGGNIRVAFLFNPDRVSFVDRSGGDFATPVAVSPDLDGTPRLSISPGRIDPTNVAWENSRKPLVGEFVFGGSKVIVVANHFNSKGGDQNADGRFQPPTRGSEVQRQRQATAVRAFVDQVLAVDPSASVVVAGDLNDFPFSPALQILTEDGSAGPGLVSLIRTLPTDQQYTYVFNGISQVLDHILTSPALAVDRYQVVHLNAEFSEQASDHDPQIAWLSPAPACTRTVAGLHVGALDVAAGTVCLAGALQVGPVTVRPGARLVVIDSMVTGAITATAPAGLTMCGSQLVGTVQVSGATGPVRIGAGECAASEVVGAMTLDQNTGGVVLAGNRITGSLSCTGNEPPPTNEGTPNRVVGARKGQCASL